MGTIRGIEMILTATKFYDIFRYEAQLSNWVSDNFPEGIDLTEWTPAKQAALLQANSRLLLLLRENGLVPSFDMENWDLRELVFDSETRFERINAWKVKFDGAELPAAQFQGAYLAKGSFNRAHAHYADFSGARLYFAQFNGAKINDSRFIGSNLIRAEFGDHEGWFCSAVNCSFRGADLREAVFVRADVKRSDFKGAVLRGARFINSDLRNVDFRGADLHGAVFGLGTKVKGAKFEGADLDRSLEQMLAQADKGEVE